MADDVKKLDRRAIAVRYLALAMAAAAIGFAGWGTAHRLAEVAPGHDISIAFPFTAEQGQWFFQEVTEIGESVDISFTAVTIPYPNPTPAMLVALWADPIATFLAVAAGSMVAATFLQRLARGKALEEGTARLVFAGAGILAAWWGVNTLATVVTTMGIRELFFDKAHEGGLVPIELSPLIWALFLGAVGVAFRLGERLRRDTAGLV